MGVTFVAMAIAMSWQEPVLLPVFLVFGIVVAMRSAARTRESRKIALEREGLSICEFARSFDRRSVDPYIIRAVYEGLAEFNMVDGKNIPIMPDDDLFKDYGMDPDDLHEDVMEVLAFRTGRSIDYSNENPFTGEINTARDLVFCLNGQPMQNTTP